MFNQQEVQILIGGVNAPIDLDDLRQHTNYGGLYDDDHEVIKAFWNVRHHNFLYLSSDTNFVSFSIGRQLVRPRTETFLASLRYELQ